MRGTRRAGGVSGVRVLARSAPTLRASRPWSRGIGPAFSAKAPGNDRSVREVAGPEPPFAGSPAAIEPSSGRSLVEGMHTPQPPSALTELAALVASGRKIQAAWDSVGTSILRSSDVVSPSSGNQLCREEPRTSCINAQPGTRPPASRNPQDPFRAPDRRRPGRRRCGCHRAPES